LGRKLAYHQERLVAVDDEKKRERKEGRVYPETLGWGAFHTGFLDKMLCRIDPKTCKIQKSGAKLATYWMRLLTL